ncbi:MAG: hypothetical protein O7G13_11060, partial [Alphaproteobacteria bacterium]|nr:hypothetical protein [Alphaproteobacteria bacterium]
TKRRDRKAALKFLKRAMKRYDRPKKFASAHASIHNHFNKDRHLNCRNIFKRNRAAALAEWCQLAA